ncbi:unnamed protein product [Mytilus coruscus]|uniref:MAM domain-containing protein n=1 Tax=Mytilus coruscus TaxID=42192 RepID=A0A6J8F2B1_MYTCO|nr:unnamed protein product [Mytilus coruscus]
MNCTATTVINILNITLNENSKCKPTHCILSEEQKITTKAICDEQHACNITANIPNSCLFDLGFLNYSYTCEVIAHSCNFEHGLCGWVYSPQNNDEFCWKRKKDATSSRGTGPLSDHTTGSGFYAYTEASEGSLGDIAKLESVEITSSPYQCLSFWYHMRGRDIGSLLVYQIYTSQKMNMLVWTVNGEKGTAWIYQAINLTYKNDNFQIKFEGVRGDGSKGDIALDDITITNTYCKDFSSSCQQSYSDQCKMKSNEESSEFIEKCRELYPPISLSSCSKKYLTVDNDSFIFDPELDFCYETYVNTKASLCNNIHGSDTCTVDLHWIIQSNPECFNRYSMAIEYTCEGIAVGVSIGCGMVASIVIIIIFFIRRSDKNIKGSNIQHQNNCTGNQGVALPQKTQQRSDKIELIGDITVDQHYHDITCSPSSNVTDEEYTYIDSINNYAYKCTTVHGRKINETKKKIDLSIPSSNDTTNHNLTMSNGNVRRQNVQCDIANAYGRNETIYNVSNNDNEYALIDQSDERSGQVNTSGTSTFENYVVLDPNETGFNRHVEHDKCSHKPEKSANENRLGNDINKQKASPYEITTEGTYDSAGINMHTDNANTIYNHTVDDVYDASSHERKGGEREDTYDHFLGQKTDDDYDIMKCT